MQKHTDVTQEELDQMAFIHKALSFSKDEAMGIVNLSRKYVNPHTPDCLSCSSNLRDAKNALCSFYLLYKDEIQVRLAQEVINSTIEKATTTKKKK